MMDANSEVAVARELGIPSLSFFSRIGYGGGAACATVQRRPWLCDGHGVGGGVLPRVQRAVRAAGSAASRRRGGRTDVRGIDNSWHYPMGLGTPAATVAMFARRYMHEYGATSEDFGRVAVADRRHAATNPKAWFYNRPITLEDHQSSRWIAEPLRLLDCCQESDGGVALVVTSTARAADLPNRPAVSAAAQGSGQDQFTMNSYYRADLTGPAGDGRRGAAAVAAERPRPTGHVDGGAVRPLHAVRTGPAGGAGLLPARRGHATSSRTARLELDGRLPTNPHGGQLGEAYIHGMNGIAEASARSAARPPTSCQGGERAGHRRDRRPDERAGPGHLLSLPDSRQVRGVQYLTDVR